MNPFARIVLLVVLLAGVACAQSSDDWSGWFGGVYGGYLAGEITVDDQGHLDSTGDFEDDGPAAGLFAVHRTVKPNGWIYGFEVDLPLYMQKGTAVDKVWFPDVVTYEASYRWGILVGAQAGRVVGQALIYGFGLVGYTSVDGKTYNVDEFDQLSMGFVQSAVATHMIWQLGIGGEVLVNPVMFVGARVALFTAAKADHTMPWNTPGPNEFGYNATLIRMHMGKRF